MLALQAVIEERRSSRESRDRRQERYHTPPPPKPPHMRNVKTCVLLARFSGRRHKQASTRREKIQEKQVGCQYSSMLCFHMYKPRTNSEYASNQTVHNCRNTSSSKALACWFFKCTKLKQTLFKSQIYGAGPCQQVRQDLKESSFFFARGNCRFPPLPRIEV